MVGEAVLAVVQVERMLEREREVLALRHLCKVIMVAQTRFQMSVFVRRLVVAVLVM
jgi:hypothetical protein